jgi:hypothetical protein
VQRLRWKLDLVLQSLPPLPLEELLDDGQATKTSRRRPGQVGGKHWQQEVSIVRHLARIGGLSDSTTVAVELGAGTARLSERLQQLTGARFSHVLVDRQQFKGRACSDHAMRKRASPSGQPSDAPPDAVGTLTSGGTESLLLAVKSARDRAKKLKPWIRQPEMVAPLSGS